MIPLVDTVAWEARFRAKIEVRAVDDCWPWLDALDAHGYGAFWDGARTPAGNPAARKAHRLAFFLAYGHLPPVVRHRCDMPICCNPAHLTAGSQADNVRDMVERGRSATGDRNGSRTRPDRRARGERSGSAVLSAADVADIRSTDTTRRGTKAALARRFGVNEATVRDILSGRIWRDSYVSPV